jgi:ankyrin repeat protein
MFAVYYRRDLFVQELAEAGAGMDVFEAAALGDLQKIRNMVGENPDQVHAYSSDGFQALGLAAYFGHQEVAEFLLSRGADPNSTSYNQQKGAPLHSAASSNSVGIASALIEKGAEVNLRQHGGYTPLHAAVQNGSVEMVELLIRAGADCLSRTEAGQTPGEVANRKNRTEIDRVLETCSEHAA